MGYGSPKLGTSPDWQCDWVSGKSWSLKKSREIRIVRHDGSDVKAPWELSRLQWSPVVAKAYVLTGDRRYRETLRSLLTDWIVRNPVGKGVNWTVAMEAALRGISLCLTMDLLWPFSEDEKPWLDQMTASLWQHLRFIEAHSEFSFLLRSNHYLSNIVGLTTLSAYLDGPGMSGGSTNMRGLCNERFCCKRIRMAAIVRRPPVITSWWRRCFCIRWWCSNDAGV